MKGKNISSTFRYVRATTLTVLMLAVVLSAGVLPACIPGVCCPVVSSAASAIHAQMPCCAVPSSIAPRDLSRVQPATLAGSTSLMPQTWAPVAVVVRPGAQAIPSRVQATLVTVTDAHHEHSPPLFLLNAQFLI